MKTVALLMQEIWSGYTKGILKGVLDYFSGKDVNVLTINTRLPIFDYDTFGLQYWSGLKMCEAKDIDALIVCTPTFCSRIPSSELSEFLNSIPE